MADLISHSSTLARFHTVQLFTHTTTVHSLKKRPAAATSQRGRGSGAAAATHDKEKEAKKEKTSEKEKEVNKWKSEKREKTEKKEKKERVAGPRGADTKRQEGEAREWQDRWGRWWKRKDGAEHRQQRDAGAAGEPHGGHTLDQRAIWVQKLEGFIGESRKEEFLRQWSQVNGPFAKESAATSNVKLYLQDAEVSQLWDTLKTDIIPAKSAEVQEEWKQLKTSGVRNSKNESKRIYLALSLTQSAVEWEDTVTTTSREAKATEVRKKEAGWKLPGQMEQLHDSK